MILTEMQKTVSNSKSRFKVLCSGRRSGKTYLSINEMAKHARHPNRKVMYIAPSYRMARQIVWDDLKEMLRAKNWIKKINESNLEITLVNNSLIMLRSADNPDSIRGIGLDYVICDEFADFAESAWPQSIRPCLSDREGGALITGTPKGRNHFWEMFTNANSQQDWQSWQYTTAQAGIVSEEELAQAKAELDQRSFEQEYEGQFVNYAGVIYYAFDQQNVDNFVYNLQPRERIMVGVDFNVSPLCAVIAKEVDGKLWVFDEIEIYNSNTNELCDEIKTRYPEQLVDAYPDASGAQRRTSAGGVTDHIILHNAGFKVHSDAINPSVKDRIATVNALLCSTSGERKLMIDPKCKTLINGLTKHVYREGTRQPEKDGAKDFSHINDALGYMCIGYQSMKPITKKMGKMRMHTGGIHVR